jgi:ABC-type transporter Mla subunit MlaD
VRFRGIAIGRVARIGLAPDRRHVEIECALTVARLQRLGLAKTDGTSGAEFALEPDMRAQLAQPGLAGAQILAIDYFDPATHPPPQLPFPVSPRTIPSTPSALAGLEDSLTLALARLPDLIARASRLFGAGSDIVTQLADARVGARTEQALRGADEVLTLVREDLTKLGTAHVPEQLGRAVGTLDSALSRLDRLLSHVDGQQGLVTSAERATDAVGDAAHGSHDLVRQLDGTLREVRRTAETVRRLADALDRNPDIFLKGRPKETP